MLAPAPAWRPASGLSLTPLGANDVAAGHRSGIRAAARGLSMHRSGFMIYGAYGYTGELIARQAVRRGHRPLLAGRQGSRLAALARELGGLPWVTVALDDPP